MGFYDQDGRYERERRADVATDVGNFILVANVGNRQKKNEPCQIEARLFYVVDQFNPLFCYADCRDEAVVVEVIAVYRVTVVAAIRLITPHVRTVNNFDD